MNVYRKWQIVELLDFSNKQSLFALLRGFWSVSKVHVTNSATYSYLVRTPVKVTK